MTGSFDLSYRTEIALCLLTAIGLSLLAAGPASLGPVRLAAAAVFAVSLLAHALRLRRQVRQLALYITAVAVPSDGPSAAKWAQRSVLHISLPPAAVMGQALASGSICPERRQGWSSR